MLPTHALRWLGLSGIVGALLFVAGDLLYNYIPGSRQTPADRMSTLPESRLLNAATLGLFGCWLYTLASAQVYLALWPVSATLALTAAVAFAAVMVAYGICHAAYFAIASGAQAAVRSGCEARRGGSLGEALFARLVKITYVPVAVATLTMAYAILSGRSLYPRWMVLFLPALTYLLKTPLARSPSSRIGEIIRDSYDNMTLLAFYLISTIVLWSAPVA